MSKKMKYICIGVAVFIILGAFSAFMPKKLSEATALEACTKAAQESNKLKTSTTIFDEAMSENLNSFTPVGDTLHIRSWLGLHNAEKVEFSCYIDSDLKVQKITVFYEVSGDEVVIDFTKEETEKPAASEADFEKYDADGNLL